MNMETTATLTTMPGRERACREAVASLQAQVRRVHVHHNALGDAGKFFRCPAEGVHLVCDDDLLYAPHYAEAILEGLRRNPGSIVTLHGRILPERPLRSYYRDTREMTIYRWDAPLDVDVRVDVPGSGVMAYHTSAIRFTMDDFPQTHRNMADLLVARKAQVEGVPIVCIRHQGDEARLSPHVDHGRDTICARTRDADDSKQTDLANAIIRWRQVAA